MMMQTWWKTFCEDWRRDRERIRAYRELDRVLRSGRIDEKTAREERISQFKLSAWVLLLLIAVYSCEERDGYDADYLIHDPGWNELYR